MAEVFCCCCWFCCLLVFGFCFFNNRVQFFCTRYYYWFIRSISGWLLFCCCTDVLSAWFSWPLNVCSLCFTLYTKQLFHLWSFSLQCLIFFFSPLSLFQVLPRYQFSSKTTLWDNAVGCVWSWGFLKGGGRKRNNVVLKSGPVWGVQSKMFMLLWQAHTGIYHYFSCCHWAFQKQDFPGRREMVSQFVKNLAMFLAHEC